ncbi:class I glutamine amidotransferase-like protein [Peziza echinospora]|nr:class I glutamine amidotransferase-like protein [Peziza echinospora]
MIWGTKMIVHVFVSCLLGASVATATLSPFLDVLPKPLKFGVLLFPGFEILDVAGPLSALNALSRRLNTLNNGTNATLPSLIQITQHPGVVSTSVGLGMYETFFAPVSLTSEHAYDLDVLLVPGGVGTRSIPGEYVEYIRNVYPRLQYLLVVCTGSGIVAKSGILNGRRATGNKLAWQWVIAQGPNVKWVREARWVRDGNIWTTSGVAAGIDGAFDWIKTVYGESEAELLANQIEYQRWTNASYDPFSEIWKSTKR